MVNILSNGDWLQDRIYRFTYINIILSKFKYKRKKKLDIQTDKQTIEM